MNGLSDGTKDISVNAGTFAGNVSISGNTTIGNASGDDLTVTASLASSIPIKTTNSYDIGSSTLGLRALYFGANSQTVKIQGSSSMSATWTMTLPVNAGSTGQYPVTNGSGVLSWQYGASTSKTATYSATTDDELISCDASSGSFNINLPTAAAGNTGKKLYILRTDNTLANYVLVDTWKLMTGGEVMGFMSTGSAWKMIDHFCSRQETDYTPALNSTSNVSSRDALYRRVGNNMVIRFYVKWNGNGAPSDFTVGLPSGVTIKTSLITTTAGGEVSFGWWKKQGTTPTAGYICYFSTTEVKFYTDASSAAFQTSSNVNADVITGEFSVPITDWEA